MNPTLIDQLLGILSNVQNSGSQAVNNLVQKYKTGGIMGYGGLAGNMANPNDLSDYSRPTPTPTPKPQTWEDLLRISRETNAPIPENRYAEFGQPMPASSPQVLSSQYTNPTPTPTPVSIGDRNYGRNPSVSQFNISGDVYSAINQAAQTYGIPLELLFDIALSESSFNSGLQNTTPEGQAVGVPTGLFQFTPNTWQTAGNYANQPNSTLTGYDPSLEARSDPYINSLVAAYLIKNGQLGRWDASKGNWGQYWPNEELKNNGYYDQTQGR